MGRKIPVSSLVHRKVMDFTGEDVYNSILCSPRASEPPEHLGVKTENRYRSV